MMNRTPTPGAVFEILHLTLHSERRPSFPRAGEHEALVSPSSLKSYHTGRFQYNLACSVKRVNSATVRVGFANPRTVLRRSFRRVYMQ